MAKTIKTNNDLKVAMILTVKNGDKYVVVADDNGHHDVINLMNGKSNGIEVGTVSYTHLTLPTICSV